MTEGLASKDTSLKIHPRREAVLAGFVVLMVTSLFSTISYYQARESLLHEVQEMLLHVARTAAVITDGDLHQTIKDPQQKNGSAYLKVQEPYRQILSVNPLIAYIYTAVIKDDGVYLIIDTQQIILSSDESKNPHKETADIMEKYEDISPAMEQALKQQKAKAENNVYQDEWGVFISAYAPIYNSKQEYLGIVGVDMDASDFNNRIESIRIPYYLGMGFVFIVSIILAITVYRVRLNQINRMQHYQSTNELLKRFLANFSHELRTPLNAIIGFSEILKKHFPVAPDSGRHAGYIEDIHYAGTHLLTIINNVLEFSKADIGVLEVNTTEFDVMYTLQKCIDIMRPNAQAAEVSIITNMAPQGFLCHLDHVKFKQITINLLSNAIKYNRPGGTVTVNAAIDHDKREMIFQIVDTGIGMNEEDIKIALLPFGQIDHGLSRMIEGSGLGLPLTKKFVEAMGGTFTVESKVKIGTNITFRLPVKVS
jgi:signal transduction histidine kinase